MQGIPAVYINLDRRKDRRQQFESECQRMGIVAERFSAVTHPEPGIGCTRSHLEVLRYAKSRGYSCVAIFEDDFCFLVSQEDLNRVVGAFPDDYDVVMFDRYIIQQEPYNETFDRVIEAQSAAGYVVHSRMYDRLIETLQEAAVLYEANPQCHWLYINDQYWKLLQPVSRWYVSRLQIGRQRPGFSDLKGRDLENVY